MGDRSPAGVPQQAIAHRRFTEVRDPLVSFIWELLRDHVSFGDIERILKGDALNESHMIESSAMVEYAKDVAQRIMERRGAATTSDVWMQDRLLLLQLLRAKALKLGDFQLSSGGRSNYLVDCKPVVLSGLGHQLVGRVLSHVVEQLRADAVAGVAVGGCALASAVSSYRAERVRTPIPSIYVRKEPKDHGTGSQLEVGYDVRPGGAVVLLEDVVTTGKSSIRAIEALRAAGFVIAATVVLVDRREGGAAAIEKASGAPVLSIFTKSDFFPEESDADRDAMQYEAT